MYDVNPIANRMHRDQLDRAFEQRLSAMRQRPTRLQGGDITVLSVAAGLVFVVGAPFLL